MGYFQTCFYVCSVLFLVALFVTEGQTENALEGDSDTSLLASDEFKCPFPFGTFSDSTDCSYFYLCVAGKHSRKKCGIFRRFDFLRRVCLPIPIAMCWATKEKTTAAPKTTTVKTTLSPDDDMKCPTIIGSFPHLKDCSKYFRCMMFKASLKTCPKAQLFDALKKKCLPEKEVNCGNRERPGGYTETVIVTEMTTLETTEATTTEATEAPTTEMETTTQTEEITTTQEPTTESPTTTTTTTTLPPKPTGPPETDCDEDDVDCIIDETGDPDAWFTCPEDIGSYIHPSSDRLFIFCLNWIPSVKRCGQDLIFSKVLLSCVLPDYED